MRGTKDGVMWRCPLHKGHKLSIRDNSFFKNSNLALGDIFWLMYLWSHRIAVHTAESMLGIGDDTIRQWYQYCRDICSNYLVNHPFQIGGPGIVVQIDESVIAKRKYNRGHHVAERWVFGGYDCRRKVGFLEEVEDRTAATLLPLIQHHIAPGSIIHSDCWPAYGQPGVSGISMLPQNYVHQTVNHTRYFVDPVTHAHTNNVECMWKNCKSKFKSMNGVATTTLSSHLDEFMWRQLNNNAFDELLLNCAMWYPAN